MTQDNHKQFTFAYNYLNLPATMTKGTNVITMTYTADGEKLAKAVTGGVAKNYISGIEYSGTNLEAIYFSEGRCTPNGTTAFHYEYTIKDHLGNARVNFRANGAGVIALQENHYYPFGLEIEGPKIPQVGVENQYQYNEIEKVNDFDLGLSFAYFRSYDPALGRWWQIDPKPNFTFSSYSFVSNNPLKFYDTLGDTLRAPDGQSGQRVEDIMQGTFYQMGTSENATANLFQLQDDGVTFASIDAGDLVNAIQNLPDEGRALAIGYYLAIMSDETHVIEVVKRIEPLSEYGQHALGFANTGAEVDSEAGGGHTAQAFYKPGIVNKGAEGSYVVIVLDSKQQTTYNSGNKNPLPGELMAHELLGHGLGGTTDASIQATNLYLKASGKSYFRPDHQGAKMSEGFNANLARQIPSYILHNPLFWFKK